ncbi:hypothetical protein Ocin01_19938 [Orchesella cincta]|uniref:Uncharacterized protein n=1 Tax=Orchesella cincta TaxID=48709 RepID=A0A1D2M1B3_ORCCI|nr:hypothetical protein Ocin01_19938 [Orchesella cincta]
MSKGIFLLEFACLLFSLCIFVAFSAISLHAIPDYESVVNKSISCTYVNPMEGPIPNPYNCSQFYVCRAADNTSYTIPDKMECPIGLNEQPTFLTFAHANVNTIAWAVTIQGIMDAEFFNCATLYDPNSTNKRLLVSSLFPYSESLSLRQSPRISRGTILNHHLSHYQNNYFTSLNPITDFNKNLRPFSDCFIHFINYEGIDFHPLEYPVLLSRTILQKLPYCTPLMLHLLQHFYTFPFEYLKNWPKDKPLNVTFSRHPLPVTDGGEIEELYKDRRMKMRPWYCEAHLYLFPPFYEKPFNYFLAQLDIPEAFKGFWRYSSTSLSDMYVPYQLYSRRPDMFSRADTMVQYHILVGRNRSNNELTSETTESWLRLVTKWRWAGYSTSHRYLIWEMDGNGLSISLACQTCNICNPFEIHPMKGIERKSQISSKELDSSIQEMDNNPSNTNWVIELENKNLYSRLKKAGIFPQKVLWGKLLNKASGMEDIRWKIKTLLLGSIISNATYKIYNQFNRRCNPFCRKCEYTTETLSRVIRQQNVGLLDPLDFSLETTKLRFFDSKHLVINNEQLKWKERLEIEVDRAVFSIFMYYKPLVEQGSPIPQYFSLTRKVSTNFLAIPFLFMAIVISCAYKNENISRLTSPISSIPFDEFKLLRETSFLVFTKAERLTNFVRIPDNLEGLRNMEPVLRSRHIGNANGFNFKSELKKYVDGNYRRSTNYTKEIATYLNHSQLHPTWWKEAYDGKVDYMDFIKDCNYTALIQEDQDAREMHFKWKRSGKKHAFLSKDILLSMKQGGS